MAVAEGDGAGLYFPTRPESLSTARVEPTSGGRIDVVHHFSRNSFGDSGAAELRHAREECSRVRVARGGEEIRGSCAFDYRAAVHDADSVRRFSDDSERVAHKNKGHALRLDQRVDEA